MVRALPTLVVSYRCFWFQGRHGRGTPYINGSTCVDTVSYRYFYGFREDTVEGLCSRGPRGTGVTTATTAGRTATSPACSRCRSDRAPTGGAGHTSPRTAHPRSQWCPLAARSGWARRSWGARSNSKWWVSVCLVRICVFGEFLCVWEARSNSKCWVSVCLVLRVTEWLSG